MCADVEETSSLIGYSLALFMIGISISPLVAGLLPSLSISFMMAIGSFIIAILYSLLSIKLPLDGEMKKKPSEIQNDGMAINNTTTRTFQTLFSPLKVLKRQPGSLLLSGISLFSYNCVQSYTFSALLIFTSTKFGFTSRENGLILTITHSIAATYLFVTLYFAPYVWRHLFNTHRLAQTNTQKRLRIDATLTIASMSIQTMSLITIAFANQTFHIYVATVLLAIGLPAPSYLKGHVVGQFDGAGRSEALAALTAMEVIGDIFGPLTLGIWQSTQGTSGGVFLLSAVIMVASITLFCISLAGQGRAADEEQNC